MKNLKKYFVKSALMIATGLIALSSANAYQFKIDGGTTKDLIPQQRQMAVTSPNYDPVIAYGKHHLTVRAWVDHNSGKNKPPIYYLGNSVQFYVQANKDCYITLLDIGTTGKTHIIFPNDYQRNNFVKAGQTLSVPQAVDSFDFKVTGKRGNEIVKVIATVNRIDVIPEEFRTKTGIFSQIRAKDISVVATGVNEILNGDGRRNRKEWAEYTKILKIR